MNLIEGEIYHIFNRGNNREIIFPQQRNYQYFLHGIGKYVRPNCDILAWCLMPNHFHLLIHANEFSTSIIKDGSIDRQQFSQGIKQLLSSYAKAINKQQGRTGSLFQQKTKGILVSDRKNNYALGAFHYIHQNPMKAALIDKMEDWEFSSFNEYFQKTKNGLCNKRMAIELLDIDPSRFYQDSYLAQKLLYPFDEGVLHF